MTQRPFPLILALAAALGYRPSFAATLRSATGIAADSGHGRRRAVADYGYAVCHPFRRNKRREWKRRRRAGLVHR
jgi:hypothetical protein